MSVSENLSKHRYNNEVFTKFYAFKSKKRSNFTKKFLKDAENLILNS